jgi:ubiquinone/menaquinone biosynthesis C-methylase UbiE
MRDYIKYWQLWHHNWDDTDLSFITKELALKNKDVIEIGCADGRLTFPLANICRSIVGVDIDNRFIEIAKGKTSASAQENIRFITANACALPFASNSADFILFPWSFHEIVEARRALEESHRVLKENGAVLIMGLRSDSDYESIINNFVQAAVNNDQAIDLKKRYEEPLSKVFGNFTDLSSKSGLPCRYFFTSKEIAYDAFDFALGYWYQKQLTETEKDKLEKLIDEFWNGEQIELVFPASVYKATKINK